MSFAYCCRGGFLPHLQFLFNIHIVCVLYGRSFGTTLVYQDLMIHQKKDCRQLRPWKDHM